MTAVTIFTSIILAFATSDSRNHFAVVRWWSRAILTLSGVTVHLEGAEHLESNQCYVFAANHASHIDIPVLLASLPCEVRFIAEDRLFWMPVFGSHLRRAGYISAPRRNFYKRAATLRTAVRLLSRERVSLVVFPEGGRALNGVCGFRNGAAYIAMRSHTPVVPIALNGTRHILPYGSPHIRKGTATVVIGTPMCFNIASKNTCKALTQEIRSRIIALNDTVV